MKNYLGLSNLIMMCLMGLFLFWVGLIFLGFFIILLTLSLGYFFRQKKSIIVQGKEKTCFSPYTGEVQSIFPSEEGGHFLVIAQSFFDEYGIYSPLDGEVVTHEVQKEMKFLYRYHEFQNAQEIMDMISTHGQAQIEIQAREGGKIGLHCFRCYLGGRPQVWPRTGDRCHVGAHMGFTPCGGIGILQLPANARLLVHENARLQGGQTPIAFLES